MKTPFAIVCLLAGMAILLPFTLQAQNKTDKLDQEIRRTLSDWNSATSSSDLERTLNSFDETGKILLAGSDSGEIYRGKEEIRGWLAAIYKNHSFSWEMNQVDIDGYENTAWVFVDGFMVVKNTSTGKVRRTPYRFTGILVRKGTLWKWRLFDGSIPAGE
jgi:ketosteroid isomerase-like protein